MAAVVKAFHSSKGFGKDAFAGACVFASVAFIVAAAATAFIQDALLVACTVAATSAAGAAADAVTSGACVFASAASVRASVRVCVCVN